MKHFGAVALLAALSAANAVTLDHHFVTSVLEKEKIVRKEIVDRNAVPKFPHSEGDAQGRHLTDSYDIQSGCDVAFSETCLMVTNCVTCFGTLATQEIDWATIAPGTSCHKVVDFLFDGGYCLEMKNDSNAVDHFCKTFDACVVWDEKNARHNDNDKNSTEIDCSHLTDCYFPGMKEEYIGDGICHDALPGCYNSEACEYDGGDCCYDTCEQKSGYKTCGMDGYACRDPDSDKCDPTLTSKCPNDDKQPEKRVQCKETETVYKINMFDSFGDGWDQTTMNIRNRETGDEVYKGQLEDGYEGTEYICLSKSPACYNVRLQGGVWGNEVSWEVKPLREGSPFVAAGGAPYSCEFPVAGDACPNTCEGHANKNHIDDPDYKDYKQMYECIKDKCLIQVGTCFSDPTCEPCLEQDTPEYCFSNANFNAVINCGLCQCRDDMANSEYCNKNAHTEPALSPVFEPDEPNTERQCSPRETMQGSGAVANYAQCTDFDKVQLMVTEFDNENFGTLDVFERCAHAYENEPMHGGYTALGCMRILTNAIENPTAKNTNAPAEAISGLAKLLYTDAQNFCDCSMRASEDCPLCPSFLNFKTFLYESLDACQSLDIIDCAAWQEFYEPCKANLENVFTKIDFGNPAQCDYVKDDCGGAGPFPAFRRLDCGSELPRAPWDFYNNFASVCMNHDENSGDDGDDGDDVVPITPRASPSPVYNPPPVNAVSTPKPTVKYVSEDDETDAPAEKEYEEEEEAARPKSHFWRNMLIFSIIGGAGYYAYKRRQDGFQFVRYRRAQRNFGEGDGVYSGLDMSASTTFEPPMLPPPPSAMPQQQQP